MVSTSPPEVALFIYMMLNCKRKAYAEEIYQEFLKRFRDDVRECVLRESGARDVSLVFRTDGYQPFIDFAQEQLRREDYVRWPAEFAYDDGSFRFMFIHDDRVVEEDDWDHQTEMTHLDVLTRVRDNQEKALEVWVAEIGATAEQLEAKRERLQEGKKAWNAKLERDMQRWERQEAKKRAAQSGLATAPESPRPATAPKVQYRLPPNLSKTKVLEIIQKLNTSGEVLIPVFVLKDEIDKKLTKDEMIRLHLAWERSEQKAAMFQDLRAALDALRQP